jgi:acyl carrier protein
VSAQPLLDIVVEAWTQALLSGSLDLGLTWREAGGDSLGLMRLSLAFEKSLGRKLTFDQLDSDMTVTQLAQVLVQRTIAEPESNAARVHLIPGMLGDDPTFGDFRRSLVGVRTALVELPDLSCPHESFETSARRPPRWRKRSSASSRRGLFYSGVAALAEWSRTRSRNASPPAVAKSLSWRCSTPISSIMPNHATLSRAVSSGRNRS